MTAYRPEASRTEARIALWLDPSRDVLPRLPVSDSNLKLNCINKVQ